MPLSLILPPYVAGVITSSTSLHCSVPTASWEKKKGTGSNEVVNPHMYRCVGCIWQGFGGRRAVGVIFMRRSWGLPHQRCLCDNILGIGQNILVRQKRSGGGKSEKQQRKHQGQRMKKKKKKRFFRYQSRYSPAAQGEDHTRADGYSWNNCSQWKDHIRTDFLFPEGWQLLERTHTWEGGKCAEEGAAERNCCVLTVNHSYHPPCDTQEGDERSPEWRSEVEPGKRRCCFMYVLLFLTTQPYLNWQ